MAFFKCCGDVYNYWGFGESSDVLTVTGASKKTIMGLDDWYSNGIEWLDGIRANGMYIALPIPSCVLSRRGLANKNEYNASMFSNYKITSISPTGNYSYQAKLGVFGIDDTLGFDPGILMIGIKGTNNEDNAAILSTQNVHNSNGNGIYMFVKNGKPKNNLSSFYSSAKHNSLFSFYNETQSTNPNSYVTTGTGFYRLAVYPTY